MLRKIRLTFAMICFVLITLLFLDFTGTLHGWFGWLAKIQFLPAVFKSGKTKRSTLQKRRVSKSTKTTRTKKSGEPGPSLHDQSPPLFSHLNTI